MALPYFYQAQIPAEESFILEEETSKHAVQVLRMNNGDKMLITNGKGLLATVAIIDAHKKKCAVKLEHSETIPAPFPLRTIGISLLKNASRLEWFLEKATEIGINAFVPLLCHRTERQHFREERLKGILISAMLQSQKAWLPELYAPLSLEAAFEIPATKKWIAHCMDGEKKELKQVFSPEESGVLLIGPEGDFTEEELAKAEAKNFIPVGLGQHRLRTETAGLYGAVVMAG